MKKTFRVVLVLVSIIIFAGCASTPTSRPTNDVAEKVRSVFPGGARLYWVPSDGVITDSGQVTRLAMSSNESSRALTNVLLGAKGSDFRIAVAGPNSTLSRAVAVRALGDIEAKLPGLQFLFVGDEADAMTVKNIVESKGGRFFHRN
jgi:hypothetical protein